MAGLYVNLLIYDPVILSSSALNINKSTRGWNQRHFAIVKLFFSLSFSSKFKIYKNLPLRVCPFIHLPVYHQRAQPKSWAHNQKFKFDCVLLFLYTKCFVVSFMFIYFYLNFVFSLIEWILKIIFKCDWMDRWLISILDGSRVWEMILTFFTTFSGCH